jgi:hypothetical protein
LPASDAGTAPGEVDEDLDVSVVVVHELLEAALDDVGERDQLGNDPLGLYAVVLKRLV